MRIRSNGEEIHGQFSPVLHHQLTPHRISISRHSGHDEVDGSGTKYYAGNVVNRRGELILNSSDCHHHSGSAGYASSNVNAKQSLLHLPKGGNLVQTISELLETDSSKAVVGVLVFIVLSVIVAAFLK